MLRDELSRIEKYKQYCFLNSVEICSLCLLKLNNYPELKWFSLKIKLQEASYLLLDKLFRKIQVDKRSRITLFKNIAGLNFCEEGQNLLQYSNEQADATDNFEDN